MKSGTVATLLSAESPNSRQTFPEVHAARERTVRKPKRCATGVTQHTRQLAPRSPAKGAPNSPPYSIPNKQKKGLRHPNSKGPNSTKHEPRTRAARVQTLVNRAPSAGNQRPHARVPKPARRGQTRATSGVDRAQLRGSGRLRQSRTLRRTQSFGDRKEVLRWKPSLC